MNLIYIYIFRYIYTYIAFLYNKLICIWVYKLPIYECHLEHMWHFLDGQVLPVQIKMEDTLAEYYANLRNEQAEVALHRPAVKKQWKTK